MKSNELDIRTTTTTKVKNKHNAMKGEKNLHLKLMKDVNVHWSVKMGGIRY